MTYRAVACDLLRSHWGVATQSKFLAVGSVVPWGRSLTSGAIATQSYANPSEGPTSPARDSLSAETLARLTEGDEGAPASGRRRRRPGPSCDLHRRLHGLGRGARQHRLRRTEHPRLRCDGGRARRHLRSEYWPAGRAPARLPRRRSGRRETGAANSQPRSSSSGGPVGTPASRVLDQPAGGRPCAPDRELRRLYEIHRALFSHTRESGSTSTH